MSYPRSPLWKQYIHFIAHSFLSMDGHWMTWDVDSSHSNSFHHCCQLKSSLLPKTKKNPRMVANMTVFPVRTSAQAPHLIYGKRKDKFYIHKKIQHALIALWMGKTPSFHKVVLFNAIFKLQYLLTLRLSCLVEGKQLGTLWISIPSNYFYQVVPNIQWLNVMYQRIYKMLIWGTFKVFFPITTRLTMC